MTVERLSLALLALIAVVMGANYVSASSRFLDANRAFAGLELQLESLEYRDPQSPVDYAIIVRNTAGTEVEVLAMRTTLRAGLQIIGGGQLQANETVAPGGSIRYDVTARINDVRVMERAEASGPIEWLVQGEVQVRFDHNVDPVWVSFAVTTESS